LRNRRLTVVLGPCLTPCVQVDLVLIRLGGRCVLVLGFELTRVLMVENLLESSRVARCRFAAFGVARPAVRLNRLMIWSQWKSPRNAQQIDQSEIEMNQFGTNWISHEQVRSISTSFGTFERSESNAVQFLDFGFESGIVTGIEVRLVATRLARIQDKTIQLVYQNQPISENKQNLLAADTNVYGDAHDRWGITSDRNIPVESSEFGVIIDLQPHTTIPCADTVYIRSIQMRVAYP